MKKEFYGICVIEKLSSGEVTHMACVSRKSKDLPKETSRVIGDLVDKVYWFNTIPEAEAFYNTLWIKVKRKVA